MSMTGVTCAEILKGFRDNDFLYFHTCKKPFVIHRLHDPPRYKCSEVSRTKRKQMV